MENQALKEREEWGIYPLFFPPQSIARKWEFLVFNLKPSERTYLWDVIMQLPSVPSLLSQRGWSFPWLERSTWAASVALRVSQ